MAIFKLFKKKKAGTTSKISELRSPYTKKPSLPTKFFKRGKRRKMLVMPTIRPQDPSKIKKTLILTGGFVVFAGLIYLIGFSHFFDIKTSEIYEDGNKVTDDVSLNNLLNSEKNKNLFFLNQSQLIQQIWNIHPEVKNVVIEKVFPKEIKVEIEKYPIIANIINVVQGIQKKFLMNSQGFLTDENLENSSLPYIKIFTDTPLDVHTTVIDQDKLTYILSAIAKFQEMFSLKILNAEYHVRDRDLYLQTEKNFIVKIDIQNDLIQQLNKLKAALPQLDIYNTPLEYIDLRIAGIDNQKVYYKLAAPANAKATTKP